MTVRIESPPIFACALPRVHSRLLEMFWFHEEAIVKPNDWDCVLALSSGGAFRSSSMPPLRFWEAHLHDLIAVTSVRDIDVLRLPK